MQVVVITFSTGCAGGNLPYYRVFLCFLVQGEGDALFVQSYRQRETTDASTCGMRLAERSNQMTWLWQAYRRWRRENHLGWSWS